MLHRKASRPAVIAGAVLFFSVPILEIALAIGVTGPVRLAASMLGAGLLVIGLSGLTWWPSES
jgi:hypothetical protein